MSVPRLIVGIATVMAAIGTPVGWLWHLKASQSDLEAHVLAHAVQRANDQAELGKFMVRDSAWKAEQRAIVYDIWCHMHKLSSCDVAIHP
jgi:hypothetical protein